MEQRNSLRLGLIPLALVAALACGAEEGGPSQGAQSPQAEVAEADTPAGEPPAETPVEAGAEALSGLYEVRGATVQAANGRLREISGTVELRVEGERYEANFDLATTYPDVEGVPVKVTGGGHGRLVGRTFAGTTEEEMAIDPARRARAEAELPTAGLKIVSTSQAHFDEEGLLHIHLQNQAAEGAPYSPSVTVLEGRRMGGLPGVAAPSPPQD